MPKGDHAIHRRLFYSIDRTGATFSGRIFDRCGLWKVAILLCRTKRGMIGGAENGLASKEVKVLLASHDRSVGPWKHCLFCVPGSVLVMQSFDIRRRVRKKQPWKSRLLKRAV